MKLSLLLKVWGWFFLRDRAEGMMERHRILVVASMENASCLDFCLPGFVSSSPEFTMPLYWACYLLEQGSERVTQGVKREVSLANLRLLLFSCLLSTKVTWKIQLLLLTMCTRNALPVTLEVQNGDVEIRGTNTESCGPYYSTVGLVPGGTVWVEKRILAICLTFCLSHSPRDSAAVCPDLKCTASHSTVCVAWVLAPCGYCMRCAHTSAWEISDRNG